MGTKSKNKIFKFLLIASDLFWSYGPVGPGPTLFKEPSGVNITVPLILDFIRHCLKNKPLIIHPPPHLHPCIVQYFLALTQLSNPSYPFNISLLSHQNSQIHLSSFIHLTNIHWVSTYSVPGPGTYVLKFFSWTIFHLLCLKCNLASPLETPATLSVVCIYSDLRVRGRTHILVSWGIYYSITFLQESLLLQGSCHLAVASKLFVEDFCCLTDFKIYMDHPFVTLSSQFLDQWPLPPLTFFVLYLAF